jgi:hypothetical protein
MSASASEVRAAACGLLVALAGCGEPAQYRFGENLTGRQFLPVSAQEGVYPSRVVMTDPNNPFRAWPLMKDTRWQLLEGGATVGAFYAFATTLAQAPSGESQFYSAKMLADIAQANAVQRPEDREQVRLMAIAGYQSMLDYFPDAVSYDATGTTSFRLATPAYKAILALGGKVQGDWILVTTANGDQAILAGGP